MLLHYPIQYLGQERSYHSLTQIISLLFGVIEYIYQTNCMFITMVFANVSVLVVGSIPTGVCTPCKIAPGTGLLTETLHIDMSFD